MSLQPTRILNTFQLATPKFKLTALGGLAIVRPLWDKSQYFTGLAQSYASYTFNIAGNRLAQPTHPVTWYNVKTNRPAITIPMLSDTGADYSTLDAKHAAALGIDLTKGLKATVSGTGGMVEHAYYIHSVPFQIGNLKPVKGLVAIGTGGGMDVLGRTAGLNWYIINYVQGKTIKYTELAANAQSGLGQARWRGRI